MCGCAGGASIPQIAQTMSAPQMNFECGYTIETIQQLEEKLDRNQSLPNYNSLKGYLLSAKNQPSYICTAFFTLIQQIEALNLE